MKKIVYLANNEYTGNNKALCNLNSVCGVSLYHTTSILYIHVLYDDFNHSKIMYTFIYRYIMRERERESLRTHNLR